MSRESLNLVGALDETIKCANDATSELKSKYSQAVDEKANAIINDTVQSFEATKSRIDALIKIKNKEQPNEKNEDELSLVRKVRLELIDALIIVSKIASPEIAKRADKLVAKIQFYTKLDVDAKEKSPALRKRNNPF
jgi:hypothetical protein